MLNKKLNELEIDDKAKEQVEFFLFNWAVHFRKNKSFGDLHTAIRFIITDDIEEYEKKYDEHLHSQNVLSHLERLKRFGKRGQTSQELVSHFSDSISARAVYEQLKRLVKGRQVKEIKTKAGKHELIIYEAI